MWSGRSGGRWWSPAPPPGAVGPGEHERQAEQGDGRGGQRRRQRVVVAGGSWLAAGHLGELVTVELGAAAGLGQGRVVGGGKVGWLLAGRGHAGRGRGGQDEGAQRGDGDGGEQGSPSCVHGDRSGCGGSAGRGPCSDGGSGPGGPGLPGGQSSPACAPYLTGAL